ncbi:hypothetical protein [Haloarcula nitratireducens]|uniref:hypothetical protein n=1 Tax=Haloarcula nitratireducens TaxID=2487749 RepID=UPI001C73A8A9|nr:hypothetical protein [Halomicroarcula nitratireducens]
MSQNQPHCNWPGVSTSNQQRTFVESVIAIVCDQRVATADLEALVLRTIARQSANLTTPDILELRAQLDVDIDEQASRRQQTRAIVDAIMKIVEMWGHREAV